jgi:hypothetical protein
MSGKVRYGSVTELQLPGEWLRRYGNNASRMQSDDRGGMVDVRANHERESRRSIPLASRSRRYATRNRPSVRRRTDHPRRVAQPCHAVAFLGAARRPASAQCVAEIAADAHWQKPDARASCQGKRKRIRISMRAPSENPPFRQLRIVAIALLVICAAGTAISMVGKSKAPAASALPTPAIRSSASAADDTPGSAREPRRSQRGCAECGVIESMREVGVLDADDGGAPSEIMQIAAGGNDRGRRQTSTGRYEYVVRMRNGSQRLLTETTPRDWVAGARINLIAGAVNPRQ